MLKKMNKCHHLLWFWINNLMNYYDRLSDSGNDECFAPLTCFFLIFSFEGINTPMRVVSRSAEHLGAGIKLWIVTRLYESLFFPGDPALVGTLHLSSLCQSNQGPLLHPSLLQTLERARVMFGKAAKADQAEKACVTILFSTPGTSQNNESFPKIISLH